MERLTGVHRDTIIATMVVLGHNCEVFLENTIRGLKVNDVQSDEIWVFVGCKEKTRERNNYSDDVGDAWCFLGIERDTKLILAWHLDKRTTTATLDFACKLRDATAGGFQLTTDGFWPYAHVIPLVFKNEVDFAQLVKR